MTTRWAAFRQRHGKHFPAETDKHVNSIRDIARKPPMRRIKGFSDKMFSAGSVRGQRNEFPRPLITGFQTGAATFSYS
jgi:hypothetical protein